jgi:hypothetical protein
MHTFHHPDAVNHRRDDRGGDTGHVCHTYREIATILTERDGTRVSPDQVEQICRTAEEKLAHALLSGIRAHPRLRTESMAGRGLRLRNVGNVGNVRDHHRRNSP